MEELRPSLPPLRENDLKTRRTLISRLRNWEDQESWRDFFNTYWKFIYGVAIRFGLSDAEAEDVVQETILTVAKKMPVFEYDPAVCSFKGWLMHVTRLRIIDQLRKRSPAQPTRSDRARNPEDTGTLERIPDPASLPLETVWRDEWEKNTVDVAMNRVKQRIKPEHYQIFYLSAVKQVSLQKVAQLLDISASRVYLVRHRVGKLIKDEIRRLERRENGAVPAGRPD